ncbi:hypothetical protein [Methanobrevibacter sp.]
MLINKKSVSAMRNSEQIYHKTNHSDIPTRTVNNSRRLSIDNVNLMA